MLRHPIAIFWARGKDGETIKVRSIRNRRKKIEGKANIALGSIDGNRKGGKAEKKRDDKGHYKKNNVQECTPKGVAMFATGLVTATRGAERKAERKAVK